MHIDPAGINGDTSAKSETVRAAAFAADERDWQRHAARFDLITRLKAHLPAALARLRIRGGDPACPVDRVHGPFQHDRAGIDPPVTV